MDTSKEYIEKCQKATEIQSLFGIADGDFCYKKVVFCICEKCNVKDSYGSLYIDEHNKAEYIWLPRQDQLQKMIDWQKIYIVREGKKYQHRSVGNILLSCDSMEQLWLAFVMKEKYLKQWSENKKEWIKAESESE